MKARLRFASVAALLGVLGLIITGVPAPAQAPVQPAPFAVSIPEPPAFRVGLRLADEAYAAKQAGSTEIAHRRAVQAVSKFRETQSSATYGHTAYGANALLQEAQLQEKILADDYGAYQSYQTLRNNYRDVPYGNEALAQREQARLEKVVDNYNRTHSPGSILYAVLDFLVRLTGARSYSYVLAILILSLLVKLALTPLSKKQFASMREQQKLQPALQEIKAKYKNDLEMQQRKTQEVLKEHGVNPVAGCLPMLAQIPVFIMLYNTIRLYQFQFVHGDFLWIGSSLSHAFPGYLATNLGQPDYPLLILYAVSLYFTSKMTMPVPTDPAQADQQRMMMWMGPFMTTFFFLKYQLPSAFVLYYFIFNVISTLQQHHMMKRGKMAEAAQPAGSASTAVIPLRGSENGNGNGRSSGKDVSMFQTKDGAAADPPPGQTVPNANGAKPTARGVIGPPKVHPKKKRR